MSDENTQVVLERADLEAALIKATEKLEGMAEKAQHEAQDAKSVSVESRNAIEKLTEKSVEIADRLIALEQRETDVRPTQRKTMGEQFTACDSYKAMLEGRQSQARFETKTAIVNTYPESSVQPLVQGDRMMSIYTTPNRRLTLRDLLPVMPTDSNLIEFTRENALTSQFALAA